MVKFVLIVVTLIDGHLNYSEMHGYETKAECEKTFTHLIGLYMKDGVPLKNIRGGCYGETR